jgi:hypothetical protein
MSLCKPAKIRSMLLGGLCGLSITACTTAQLAHIAPSTTLTSTLAVEGACNTLFVQLDQAVFDAGVQDVQSQRIPGFPFVRTNRFLSSFKDEAMTAAATTQWLEMLRNLDRQDRAIELGNLDIDAMAKLRASRGNDENLMAEVERCGKQLVVGVQNSPETIAQLRSAAQSPDSYSLTMRTLGLYPITSLFIKRGVTQLQKEIHAQFADTQRWHNASLRRLEPSQDAAMSVTQLQELMSSSVDNPLRITQFTNANLQAIFDHFAPIWTIETLSEADRPGVPIWLRNGASAIDSARPMVYTHLSFTRFHGMVLPQFNYSIWFPERPRNGPFDILGGHLDGITLRVTVGLDGQPLMYDAMHNCGCYHMYFPPQDGLVARSLPLRGEEPLLVPITIPSAGLNTRLELYIAANTHYIEGVRTAPASNSGDDVYALRSAQLLRALPVPAGGTKSLFGSDGIVAGTQRRERWLLWPMGIIEPGAMRQWGHHAVAFFGRRHFNDADLLERYFEPL